MAVFMDLPMEIIELVGDASNTQDDLLSLSRSCKRFHEILGLRLISYNIKHCKNSGLLSAVRLHDIAAFREFIRRPGVDMDCKGVVTNHERPLEHAVRLGYDDMALLLLEHGAKADVFYSAAINQRELVVRKLVEMGRVVNFNETPLPSFYIPARGLPVAQILFGCFDEQEVENSIEQLYRLLSYAALDDCIDIVRLVLSRDIDVNLPGLARRRSALYRAILGGGHNSVDLLLHHGANICYNIPELTSILNHIWGSASGLTERDRKVRDHLRLASNSIPDESQRRIVQDLIASFDT